MTHPHTALLRRLVHPDDLGHAVSAEVRKAARDALGEHADVLRRTWLYLAGPMTGVEAFNHPAFHAAETRLRAAGYEVLNPARNGLPNDASWCAHMRRDINMLTVCHGIALLPGWDASRGVKLEVEIGNLLGLQVRHIDLWVEKSQREAA